MANFTPSSIVRIGRVPWDSSYKHTRTFASASAQATWMLGRCTTALNRNDYTYVRMNNAIRVPFNAEQLYTYNYVMYQNANYGSKWFYAFIVEINYLNESATELVLELDVMQTWYFDYTLTAGFVEREHVNSDSVGEHLNAEPDMDLQYIVDSVTMEGGGGYYAVVKLNQMVVYLDSSLDTPTGSEPYSSEGKIEGIPQGCIVCVFNMGTATGAAALTKFLQDTTEVGAADTITSMYYVPSTSITSANLSNLTVYCAMSESRVNFAEGDAYVYSGGTDPTKTPYSVTRPMTLNGYTPRNKKLLCYPYCYVEVGDFSGKLQDYRWEYFTLDQYGDAKFVTSSAASCDYTCRLSPLNYNGVSKAESAKAPMTTEPFEFQWGTMITWPYSTYETWAAQNALANQLAVIGGIVSMGLSGAQMAKTEGERGAFGVAAGFGAIAGVAGTVSRMSKVPNTSKGSSEGASKMATGYQGFYIAKKCIRAEFAAIVDGFLDMYGYQVDSVKVPNVTGRPSWNYVKMANAAHRGNVPAPDMAKINAIYNAGITFWHIDNIGNYSASNALS